MFDSVQSASLSEICARHKDEQDTQCDCKGQEHDGCHCGSGHQQFPDEGLSDTRPVHPGVFTETKICHYQIEFVLVRNQEVSA
jgi:hypothetical protein